jgi:hypothetical protein
MINLAIVLPMQPMSFEYVMIPWYDISKIINQIADKITYASISMLVSLSSKSVCSVWLDKDHIWDFGFHSVVKYSIKLCGTDGLVEISV